MVVEALIPLSEFDEESLTRIDAQKKFWASLSDDVVGCINADDSRISRWERDKTEIRFAKRIP